LKLEDSNPAMTRRTLSSKTALDRRRHAEGTTLNNLGKLANSLGQPEQARRYYEQALAIFQEIGVVDSAHAVAGNLAYLDAEDTASGEASDAPPDTPAVPQEKPPQQKWRRWPWQRKPTQ
jgi:tetratricopeptide (TPR) repeat protein